MADPHSSADALLTEHFRYTPLSLIDDIINTVNAIVYRAMQALESGLLATPPSALGFGHGAGLGLALADTDGDGNEDDAEARVELENGVHQLETLLEATVDRNFDKFEIYALRNLFKVPDGLEGWMRLAHYENLTLPLPPTAPTPASIAALRTQLHATNALTRLLSYEHTRTSALLADLRSALGLPSPGTSNPRPATKQESAYAPPTTSTPAPLAFLAPSFASAPSAPLTTTAQFTAAQLPALHALLADLRPKLAVLESGRPARSGAADTPREERRTYVDGVVGRVVRDMVGERADWEGEEESGGRRAADEVAALEGVVGELGRGG